MRNKILGALLALLALALPAYAAESAAGVKIPAAIQAHIIIRSPNALIFQLDDFAAGVTAGSKNTLPPGIVSMIANMYMPLPAEAWDSERELHILVPAGPLSAGGKGVVAVFHVDSFDSFLEALGENGIETTPLQDTDEAKGLVVITLQGIGEVTAYDLGDGRVAMSAFMPSLAMMVAWKKANGWLPAPYEGDADISADIFMNSFTPTMKEVGDITASIETHREEAVRKLGEEGIHPDVVNGLFDFAAKYAPAAVSEALQLEVVGIDLTFGADALTWTSRFGFANGSLGAEMFANLMKSEPPTSVMSDRIEPGVLSYGVTAAPTALLPDYAAQSKRILADLGDMAFPEQKDALTGFVDRFFANADGDFALAGYGDAGEFQNVYWFRSKQPEELIAAYDDLMAALNAMLEKTFTDPENRPRLTREQSSIGEYEYVRYGIEFANSDRIDQLLAEAFGDTPSTLNQVRMLLDSGMYLGQRDGLLTMVVGVADAEDLAAALDLVANGEGGFMSSQAVVDTLPHLRNTQLAVSFMDADRVFALIMEQAMENLGQKHLAGRENLYLQAFRQAEADMEETGDLFGVGMGAAGGQLTATLSVTTRAINAMVRNYELYDRTLQQEAQNRNPDGSLKEQDASDDEDGEEAIVEEEIELDEPADVS